MVESKKKEEEEEEYSALKSFDIYKYISNNDKHPTKKKKKQNSRQNEFQTQTIWDKCSMNQPLDCGVASKIDWGEYTNK